MHTAGSRRTGGLEPGSVVSQTALCARLNELVLAEPLRGLPKGPALGPGSHSARETRYGGEPFMPRYSPAPPSEPQPHHSASPSAPSQPPAPGHSKFLGWRPSTNQMRKSGIFGAAAKERMVPAPTLLSRGCTFSEGFAWPQSPRAARHLPGAIERSGPGPGGGPEFRAIWSDTSDLRGTDDGFDMKRWRAEFADEIAKASKKRAPANEAVIAAAELTHEHVEAFVIHEALQANAILRGDANALEKRQLNEKQNAIRRRRRIDDAGRKHRQLCADKRNYLESEKYIRIDVSQTTGFRIKSKEDPAAVAKEEQVQKTIARIMSRSTLKAPPTNTVPDPEPPSSDGDVAADEETPFCPVHKARVKHESRVLRERVKVAVTCRLKHRRMQGKRLGHLKEMRAKKVNDLPEFERTVLQDAFNCYSSEVMGRRMVQVVDLPHCLLEAGLSGTRCSERWSVDRVLKEIVFGLTLEYGSFEKIPPIDSFRGSLIPKVNMTIGDADQKSPSACSHRTSVGPELRKISSVQELGVDMTGTENVEKLASAPVAADVLGSLGPRFSIMNASGLTKGGSRTSLRLSRSQASLAALKEASDEEEEDDAATCTTDGALPIKQRADKPPALMGIDEDEEEDASLPSILDLASQASVTSYRSARANLTPGMVEDLPDDPSSPLGILSPETFWQKALPGATETPPSTPVGGSEPSRLRLHRNMKVAAKAAQALQVAKKFMLTRPICFEDFAAEIVPAVRTELTEVRHDTHFSEFMRVLEGNRNMSAVNLSMCQFSKLAHRLDISVEVFDRMVAHLPEMSDSSEESAEETDGAEAVVKVPKAVNVPISRNHEDPRLSFDVVHQLLVSMQENTESDDRKLEWEILKANEISASRFKDHRTELIRLYDFFQLYDRDHSNELSHDEVRLLLKHIGLDPYRADQAQVVQELLENADGDGNETLCFSEFLDLMGQVRVHQMRQRDKMLEPHFWRFANSEGRLDIDRVDEVLTAAGVVCKTRIEQDLQRKLIYDWDVDNSGDVVYYEFAAICQRVQERLFCHKMNGIVKYARSLGIASHKLSEFLWAFDKYDFDRSGGLNITEIAEALCFVSIDPPSMEELRDLFEHCGVRLEAEVSIEQYLQIMQNACEGRGMVSEADQFAFMLQDVPVQKLRELLSLFPLAEKDIGNLEAFEMLDLLANYLDVGTDSDLRKELSKPVGNARQLYTYCKRIAGLVRQTMDVEMPGVRSMDVEGSIVVARRASVEDRSNTAGVSLLLAPQSSTHRLSRALSEALDKTP